MVLEVYRFQERTFSLTELTDVSIGKTKTNKMVFSTEELVLIKVLRQEKRL